MRIALHAGASEEAAQFMRQLGLSELPPGMVGDEAWGYKGRAFDLGYLKAVLQVLGIS